MLHLFILTHVRYRTTTARGVQVATMHLIPRAVLDGNGTALSTVYGISDHRLYLSLHERRPCIHALLARKTDGCRHAEATGQTDARLS
jgi:hypothetical protein